MSFSPPVVNCLLKKGLQKRGVTCTPGPPWLRPWCHPLHTNRAIPFSHALRLRRICSCDESFTLRASELIQYPNDREYNLSFSEKKSNAFTQSHATKLSNPVRQPETNPVAFRLLSHTILLFVLYPLSYKDILKSFHLPQHETAPFKPHLVAFRRTNNLIDILVRSKLRADKQTYVTK